MGQVKIPTLYTGGETAELIGSQLLNPPAYTGGPHISGFGMTGWNARKYARLVFTLEGSGTVSSIQYGSGIMDTSLSFSVCGEEAGEYLSFTAGSRSDVPFSFDPGISRIESFGTPFEREEMGDARTSKIYPFPINNARLWVNLDESGVVVGISGDIGLEFSNARISSKDLTVKLYGIKL